MTYFFILAGRPLFVWTGLLALLFFIPTAIFYFLSKKDSEKIKWHLKLGPIAIVLIIIHVILALLSLF